MGVLEERPTPHREEGVWPNRVGLDSKEAGKWYWSVLLFTGKVGNMTGKWFTMSEACQVKGVTDRTLRRWIKDGKVETKKENGKRFVLLDMADTEAVNSGHDTDTVLVEQIQRENELLRRQIEEKDR